MIKSLFTTYTIEKEIENNNNSIYEMKLFSEDKLLIIDAKDLSIYDLLTDKFILRQPLLNKLILYKSEIIGKDKILMAVSKNALKNYLIIYQFLTDQVNNSYSLITLSEIALPNNVHKFVVSKIIFLKNKIIIIGKDSFYIYEYKNNNLALLIKIKNNPYNKWVNGFKFNKEIISLLEGNNGLIQFYNIKKGNLIQQNILYNYKKNLISILNLNDNDRIIFGIKNKILLYSFKKNNTIKTIEDKYNINCLSIKDNKLFFIGPYINMVNIENQEIKRISFYQYELSNKYEFYNLILYRNTIITNFKDKIIIFNNSIKRTLLEYMHIIYKIAYRIQIWLIVGLMIICNFCFSRAFALSFTLILSIFGFYCCYKEYFREIGHLKKYICWIIWIYHLIYFIIIIFEIYKK